jgi:hypothetical protein
MLDRQWDELMTLCASESRFREEGNHPKLLRLVKSQIDELARQMGFNLRCIITRDFRAERDGEHIVRIVSE